MIPPLLSSDDESELPPSLNLVAVLGFGLAFVVGVGGLFALPTLTAEGLSVREAFAVIGVAEFGAAVVAALAAYHLYE